MPGFEEGRVVRFNNSSVRCCISRAALLVKVTARILSGETPCRIKCAIRNVITRVLPLPAPASTRTGPWVAWTAES